MAHSEKLNQERLESLQMSNFDLSRTEWMGQVGNDVLILHNPHFNVNWEPYRMKYVLVAVCNEGSGFGRGLSDLKAAIPSATVKNGLSIQGSKVGTAGKQIEKFVAGEECP